MKEYDDFFDEDIPPEEIREIGREKHRDIPVEDLEIIVLDILKRAKEGTLEEKLLMDSEYNGKSYRMLPLYAGAAFETLIDKLMDQ